MVRFNNDPIFKENYKSYAKKEFMLDAPVQFSRLKALMDKHPKILQEDPVVGLEYLRIIELVKRKKLREDSLAAYAPDQQQFVQYFDEKEEAERDAERRRQKAIAEDRRNQDKFEEYSAVSYDGDKVAEEVIQTKKQ